MTLAMTPSGRHEGSWLLAVPARPRRFPAALASHTGTWRPCEPFCFSGCSLRRGGRGRRRDGGRPLPRVRWRRWRLRRGSTSTSYLAEHSHQLEATMMTVTVLDGQSLAISTFRKLDRMCWEIRQHYLPAQAPGRFLLKGHRKSSKVDVVVGEADASSFIILYYQKGRSISVKLYGFCDSADEFHVLDGELGVRGNALGALVCQARSHTGHQSGVPVLAVNWAHWARSTLHHGCVVLPQEYGRACLAQERP
ncbi:complement component C8 gamma chain isoform X5 [Catharus ustulatus]|uniref:complement component C8 gamma chain isoform X5 n=1 Tax=Catharus ustulatus TaxID=91951 RepID=UPI001407D8F5|nr:complement component C8 gamma chain isoform X5 [Catharus ustulatus]